MERILRSNRGYSFAEVMIAMVIMGIVALLMGTILTTSTKMHRSSFSSDDAYAIAREKLAEFQNEGIAITEGNTTDPENPIHRNNINYQRSWSITKDDTDPTAPVKAVITVQWSLGSSSKSISITGYVECQICIDDASNTHNPETPSLATNAASVDGASGKVNAGTLISKFTTNDDDDGDFLVHSLKEIGGSDDYKDNGKFTISGEKLLASTDLSEGSYKIGVLVKDCADHTNNANLTITVSNAPSVPVLFEEELRLLPENSPAGTSPNPVDRVSATGGGTIEYTDVNNSPYFEININSGIVTVQSGATLNFEANQTLPFKVKAENSEGIDTLTYIVRLSDDNDAPSGITPTSISIPVLSKSTTEFTINLDAVDEDTSDSHVFSISGTKYTLNADGSKLSPTSDLTISDNGPSTFDITTTDQSGSGLSKTVSFSVNVINSAPTDIIFKDDQSTTITMTSPVAAGTKILEIDSTVDADRVRGDYNIYTIGGPNSTSFAKGTGAGNDTMIIYSATELTDPSYEFTITSSDAFGSTTFKTITLVLNSSNNPPDITNLSTNTVYDNSVENTTVGIINYTDPDAGDNHYFYFSGGSTVTADSLFKIVGNEIQLYKNLSASHAGNYSVTIYVEDTGTPAMSSNQKTYPITITSTGGGTDPCDGVSAWISQWYNTGDQVKHNSKLWEFSSASANGAFEPGGATANALGCWIYKDDCNP